MCRFRIAMPRPLSQIDTHPRKDEIVKCLIRGDKLIDLASRFKISKQALSRFKTGPMRRAITGRNPHQSDRVSPDTVDMIRQQRDEARAVVMGESTASLVESRFSAYDRMLAKAEAKDDIAGWGGLARVQLQAYRLRAELAGELVQQAAATTQVLVLMPPQPESPQPSGPALEAEIIPE